MHLAYCTKAVTEKLCWRVNRLQEREANYPVCSDKDLVSHFFGLFLGEILCQ